MLDWYSDIEMTYLDSCVYTILKAFVYSVVVVGKCTGICMIPLLQ